MSSTNFGNSLSILSSTARIQAPWVKVTIGDYTFGVWSKVEGISNTRNNFYSSYNIQYPNYVDSLEITKINGQVNQYKLVINYPVRSMDDPNFFEEVFSSVSNTRKIIFSYGDASMPSYVYKDEEAIITKVNTSFNFGSGGQISSVISYTVEATSSAALGQSGSFTFVNNELKKPSDEIKYVLRNKDYGLQNLFTGMDESNIDKLIDSSDKKVKLETKSNISAMEYINYCVSCMIPDNTTQNALSNGVYILTIHDDTVYDSNYKKDYVKNGTYFEISLLDHSIEHPEAYELNLGSNTSTIVTNFSTSDNENYSMYYNYSGSLSNEEYAKQINDAGEYENVYAPNILVKNKERYAKPEYTTWWSKVTQYPISATITVQGLLRPATLMTYLRLNVIFPGGNKHISSGLYIITKQVDNISKSGYRTTLSLTRVAS